MTVYQVTVEMVDAYERQARKMYETQDLLDHPTALTAAAALVADLQALTEMRVLAYTVAQRVTVSDSVGATANKDEGITLVLRKDDNYKGVLKVPAPVMSVVNADGSVDVTDVLVTGYTDNFFAAGDFTFSDGEQAIELISGRLDL